MNSSIFFEKIIKKKKTHLFGTFLAVQQLKLMLTLQGVGVQSLGWGKKTLNVMWYNHQQNKQKTEKIPHL